jgi:hypothetical protein
VIRAWNHLANGAGGIDWAGLPLVVELLGIDDIADLMHGLVTIKLHKPRRPEPGEQ